MFHEYIDLSGSPVDEPCISAGEPGQREECERYRSLCRLVFPQAAEYGVHFVIRGNDHDFGRYYDVNAKCGSQDDRAMAYAYWCQDNQPMSWDDTEERIYTPEIDETEQYPDFTADVEYMRAIGR